MTKLYPWQEDLINKIDGFKPGEMITMTAGRRVGKSVLTMANIHKMMKDMYDPPLTDLLLSERHVNDSNYFCVEPVGGRWGEMEAWVRQSFGDPGDMWATHNFVWPTDARWIQNNRRFWFKYESDRTLFLMKWS